MPKVPKLSLHVYAVFPEKHGYEIDFLPADKHIDKPKLPKTKRLLFLCNILRKK